MERGEGIQCTLLGKIKKKSSKGTNCAENDAIKFGWGCKDTTASAQIRKRNCDNLNRPPFVAAFSLHQLSLFYAFLVFLRFLGCSHSFRRDSLFVLSLSSRAILLAFTPSLILEAPQRARIRIHIRERGEVRGRTRTALKKKARFKATREKKKNRKTKAVSVKCQGPSRSGVNNNLGKVK